MELIANYLGNYKKQPYAPDTIGSTHQNHQSIVHGYFESRIDEV